MPVVFRRLARRATGLLRCLLTGFGRVLAPGRGKDMQTRSGGCGTCDTVGRSGWYGKKRPEGHGWRDAAFRARPDGRWLAHTANESGPDGVYVRLFPDEYMGRDVRAERGGGGGGGGTSLGRATWSGRRWSIRTGRSSPPRRPHLVRPGRAPGISKLPHLPCDPKGRFGNRQSTFLHQPTQQRRRFGRGVDAGGNGHAIGDPHREPSPVVRHVQPGAGGDQ